ncbi:hypothetical protein ACZ87_02870 [Candidatus Erwinia dacicola]|uniref:Uncharacterized protein n=1 Tax=Candidatus Erwinia dacicola TaxID=252393 RepID=A0A328TR97_9GAMM|nr:hypothetical protein ACZ87_02870 [Candidatus Erwinia dacicola]
MQSHQTNEVAVQDNYATQIGAMNEIHKRGGYVVVIFLSERSMPSKRWLL